MAGPPIRQPPAAPSTGIALATHRALVDALARPAAWPVALPEGARFERIETHISSLLLAGDGVLKLKKPLTLPFLDFASPAQRRHFCEEELRLNRRTAPGIYRAVLPVLGPATAPRVAAPAGATAEAPDASGLPVIDWALWMRRFDQTLLYDHLAAAGALGGGRIDALATAIAAFHAGLPPSPPAFGDPDAFAAWVAGTLHELRTPPLAGLLPDDAATLAALATWSADRATALRPLMTARRTAGAVIEGHGDLHLANIVELDGRPCLFDALEFAPALRHTDRIADLAFPFMDLLDHGLPRLAWRLLSGVLDASGDHAGLPALRWLAAYRALVRAKVALLGALQVEAGAGRRAASVAAARRRVGLAARLAWPTAPAPLVLTCGLSGSGKSTVALMLAERLGAVRVRSDVERKRLHGLAPTARPADPALLYGTDSTRRTYAQLLAAARAALAGGIGVVLDAAYLRQAERQQALALARELGAPAWVVHCEAPLTTLAARVQRRQADASDPSDADLGVLARQQAWQEPPAADEPLQRLDTDASLDEVARRVDALVALLGPVAGPFDIRQPDAAAWADDADRALSDTGGKR